MHAVRNRSRFCARARGPEGDLKKTKAKRHKRHDTELLPERTIVAYINSHAEARERRTGGHVIVP